MRTSLIIATLASMSMLGACTTVQDKEDSTKLSAYAASAHFPDNVKAENSGSIGVLIEPASKVLRIVNFSQNDITNAEVWVNHDYVARVETIPPMGSVRLDETTFYDHEGHALTANPVAVTTVQLHSGDHVWNLLGPITQ
ncbi:MAG: hypothetical protein M3O30_12730 [Planctomycetota bacterium]|nr:hypothetical protein [Planctomycetota bacterium]